MATTSSTLAAGTAFGKRGKGSIMTAVATAALGLGLLAGVILGQGRQAAPAAAPDQRANPYWVYYEDAAIEGDVAGAARALIHVSPY